MPALPFRSALLACLVATVGCAAAARSPAPPPAAALTFARLGQKVTVGGPSVTPLTVIEDSRCPTDVACVWAGQVRISARIGTGAGSTVREIILGRPLPVADGTLLLAQVRPARARPGKPPAARDYRFGFRFDGGL